MELDIEVLSLSRPVSAQWAYFQASIADPRVFVTILRRRDHDGWTLRVPSGDIALDDPTGAAHHFEAAWDDGAFLFYWDGVWVGAWERPLARTSGDLEFTMSDAAESDAVLVDNVRLSSATPGGVALSAAGDCLLRLRHQPSRRESQAVEVAHGGIEFLDGPPVIGWHAPAVASFANGRRVAAVDNGGWVKALCLGLAGGSGWGGQGMAFVGHSRPALCALAERWEVLLLTHVAGTLVLTRGTLTSSGVTWDVSGQTVVVASGAAEATPALCALPDGRLYACYQKLDASLGELVSMDDGQTWQTPASA